MQFAVCSLHLHVHAHLHFQRPVNMLFVASLDLPGIDVVAKNLEQKDAKFTVRAARLSIYSIFYVILFNFDSTGIL